MEYTLLYLAISIFKFDSLIIEFTQCFRKIRPEGTPCTFLTVEFVSKRGVMMCKKI